ncbi:MAG TPA: sigma-70 family RNA polymerase sigma factor [Actinopolymorphaceae bacterium]|jgi:RNA polymerase sigma factor (sigma-70 family)|nr:sigma-70 family RNA polymerase sigma factor [Actinopolymorphaceae bacterium]
MRSTDGVALPAFQSLVDAHARDVSRLAAALAGPSDADDVAQQAWLQAWTAYPQLRTSRNLKSWLLTITARCATDRHRNRSRAPAPTDPLPDVAVSGPTEPDPALWSAVRRLPERQRLAIVLRYVADLDHASIARALDTTTAATRRLVSDALATLRTEPTVTEGEFDD